MKTNTRYDPAHLPSSLSTDQRLIERLMPNDREAFPFERELALYLLLICSLWPGDRQKLIIAARVFCGALNYHKANVARDALFSYQFGHFDFHRHYSAKKVASFNKLLFEEVGGPMSLWLTPDAREFHHEVRERLTELAMMHDVIDYLVKASIISPRLSSSAFAFYAVANNIFERANGYGVRVGPKRSRSKVEKNTRWENEKRLRSKEEVTTTHTVRQKWKQAPSTILLSFIMAQKFELHKFCPTDARFLAYVSLLTRNAPGWGITVRLRLFQGYLRQYAPVQNVSIRKWTPHPMPDAFEGAIGGVLRFSSRELNAIFKLSDSFFSKPLSELEKAEIREKNKKLAPLIYEADSQVG